MADKFKEECDSSTDVELQLQRRELELALLKEITELVGSEFDLQVVFDRVATRALELVDAETVLIPILNPEHDGYIYRAADGAGAEELLGEELPISVGLCGWVLERQMPWWCGVVESLSETDRTSWESKAGTVVLVPLEGKRHFLGGIAAMNKRDGAEFDQRDFELLTLFANQVSVAIESAMMFEDLTVEQEKAQQLSHELEVANERLLKSNQELQHLAVHDGLTGLPNRTLFMDRLDQGLRSARRDSNALSLVMIDMDRFKEINDTLGHLIGDGLLSALGQRFRSVLRDVDTLARLGGDEFAIVAPGANHAAAMKIARKLQQALQEPVCINEVSFSVGASIGVALYPLHATDSEELLRAADVAMYMSKQLREECCFYDPDYDEHSPGQFEILGDLRGVIQQQEMEIALQPKLSMSTGKIVGAEALARWYHPDRGAISPAEFVPVLEKTGLIKPFTLQVLEKSICACSQARARGFDISVAVNLSMHNLRDNRLPRQVSQYLEGYELPAGKLILEITESAIMNDPERTINVLYQLEQMGVRLSIDDFGTGYSSLSYLKKLPVHQLKIDQSFVRDVATDPDDAAIVRSTADLAASLGLSVVAEGVETEAALRAVSDIGVDLIQGYLISRPLPLEDFLVFLEEHASSLRARA